MPGISVSRQASREAAAPLVAAEPLGPEGHVVQPELAGARLPPLPPAEIQGFEGGVVPDAVGLVADALRALLVHLEILDGLTVQPETHDLGVGVELPLHAGPACERHPRFGE